ncbi:hypothetical protein KQI84_11995 [bacterium]|nr:hypothetical protein [bacterium]
MDAASETPIRKKLRWKIALVVAGAVLVCGIGTAIIIWIVAFMVFFSPPPPIDVQTSEIVSPSGNYSVYASVNRSNKQASDYAEVVIHLIDANGNELDAVNSGAGDFQKWALGWMWDTDEVVLCSSDIGTSLWQLKTPPSLEEVDIYHKERDRENAAARRGMELKKEKYH